MLTYLRGKGIPLTAYAPLAQGRAAGDSRLAALPKDQRFVRPPFAPEWDAVA